MDNQQKPDLFTVILTGGIASGKSAAADCFAELGVPIIDTDVLAREVVAPGSEGLKSVVRLFGEGVISDAGQLDRRKLRQLIFNDAEKRDQLEAILHPLIERAALEQLHQLAEHQEKPPYVIVAVPLYAETRTFRWADRVLVIDVSADTQIQRLTARDQISVELANKMLASQASRTQRLVLADDVITNEDTLDQLNRNCRAAHAKYLERITHLNL